MNQKGVLLIGPLLAFLLAASAGNASSAEEALNSLMEDFWESEVRASPLSAALFGETRFRDLVDDVSPEAFAARRDRLDQALAALTDIEKNALSPESSEQYEVFRMDGERGAPQSRFRDQLLQYHRHGRLAHLLPANHPGHTLRF